MTAKNAFIIVGLAILGLVVGQGLWLLMQDHLFLNEIRKAQDQQRAAQVQAIEQFNQRQRAAQPAP